MDDQERNRKLHRISGAITASVNRIYGFNLPKDFITLTPTEAGNFHLIFKYPDNSEKFMAVGKLIENIINELGSPGKRDKTLNDLYKSLKKGGRFHELLAESDAYAKLLGDEFATTLLSYFTPPKPGKDVESRLNTLKMKIEIEDSLNRIFMGIAAKKYLSDEPYFFVKRNDDPNEVTIKPNVRFENDFERAKFGGVLNAAAYIFGLPGGTHTSDVTRDSSDPENYRYTGKSAIRNLYENIVNRRKSFEILIGSNFRSGPSGPTHE